MTQRIPRRLDSHEVRVLGCLLEKEQATPDAYPLTVNALVAACNQRSNRDPVLNLSKKEVRIALKRLLQDSLVIREEGDRATRWGQNVEGRWDLGAPQKAALTVLLLRGPQTAGEVRARTKRLHEFASSGAAESALADLAAPPEPLVMLLELEPGQKEPRWGHCLGAEESPRAPEPPPPAADRQFDAGRMILRLERLEQKVENLESALRRLRDRTD